jgi:predicted  nucleic acid-binding Zn-ribbon protein
MADLDPNKKLNKKRMEIEIGGLQLNLQRFELRFMEIEEEKVKLQENIDSTNKRIEEIRNIIGA